MSRLVGIVSLLVVIAMLSGGPANAADCADPDRPEGRIVYNASSKVLQYCDGTQWVGMHVPGTGNGPCTVDPPGARPEGSIFYNVDHRVMQGCAGDVWRAMGPVGGAGEWRQVSAGQSHTCGVRKDGTAWCWGGGTSGQLGNNDTPDQLSPVQVQQAGGGAGWTDWIAISAGNQHTCGLREDGTAWCWGGGWSGLLGNNDTAAQHTPVQVQQTGGGTGWTDWITISAGQAHTCGLREDGTAWCWGSGADGRLGNNATADQHTPVQVQQTGGGAGWDDWISISTAAGSGHNCGVRADGSAWCWGDGLYGRLGNNATADQLTPVQVQQTGGGAGWDDWIAISAGGNRHSCGLRNDGSAWCWGYGWAGRLGNNDTADQLTPVQVQQTGGGPGWTDWTAITAGSGHNCGVRADETAWCWGGGWSGLLGNNDTADQLTPVQIGTAEFGMLWSDWIAISAGNGHSCGIRAGGSLFCFGSGSSGELGNGEDGLKYSVYPLSVAGGSLWSTISAGSEHNCGVQVDGTAWCWGEGLTGKLGNDDTANQSAPVQVQQTGGGGAWDDWVQVSANLSHSCGIRADSTAWCWGYGAYGRLGNNDTAQQNTPVQVEQTGGGAGWNDWVAISAGRWGSCGLRQDGTAWCWGRGSYGRLGNNATAQQNTPVQVQQTGGGAGWNDWVQISAGVDHTCGIREDGTAWCWGQNWYGQLGDNDWPNQSTPVQVLQSGGGGAWDDWVAISAGGADGGGYTCGVRANGTAWCWGYPGNGKLGDNDESSNAVTPVQVQQTGGGAGWEDWIAIDTGHYHTCGLREGGTAWCWGDGGDGMLGNGDTAEKTTPVQVLGGGGWKSVQATSDDWDGRHTCGVKSNGAGLCWGANNTGQLGLGGPLPGAVPSYTWCGDPGRPPGAIFYNADLDVMQYCDGAAWVAIGK